ncbi:MAG: WYL domain-containing transcriptional regulator [Chloroherpetonaceae bacterium]|nr:transcriptional regulator [Chloroherpetonaceae bacterium]MCS7211849.1 transcriptional regulator [Chloroherpetonaceae bacterium]MDW8020234.1 WYL domain-containing transcriptional regulator [Chloroherpetonaceae bacterium]
MTTSNAQHVRQQRSRPPLMRMHHIVSALQEGRYPNCASLAKQLEVSPKTIQRDIEYMIYQLGAPIGYDSSRKGYYFTEPNWFLPQVFLRESERSAMAIAEKILEQYSGLPAYDDVKAAFEKFFKQLPQDDAALRTENALFSFEPPPSSSVEKAIFRTVQAAASMQRKIKMRYHTAYSNTLSERIVHPYHFHQSEGIWYLIAYCELRQQVLTFAMNRIQDAVQLDEAFVRDDSFDLQQFLATAFLMFKGDRCYTVRIRFSPYQARWIRERVWHATQRLEDEPDGSLVLSFKVENLHAARLWVMKYGAEAEVLEPEALRDLIRQEISKMIELYSRKS